ncbi:hypothetical protein LMG3431_02345 [Achromobacter pestifer]|uniref:Uncharacterized protein n=1 Tax=Achromobacter pestifer TaxID=1353889 RepID=A0A6S6ZF28_9BURK|nr:hypothetical protein LMG3431_02345 [Achromobacter pestifer]
MVRRQHPLLERDGAKAASQAIGDGRRTRRRRLTQARQAIFQLCGQRHRLNDVGGIAHVVVLLGDGRAIELDRHVALAAAVERGRRRAVGQHQVQRFHATGVFHPVHGEGDHAADQTIDRRIHPVVVSLDRRDVARHIQVQLRRRQRHLVGRDRTFDHRPRRCRWRRRAHQVLVERTRTHRNHCRRIRQVVLINRRNDRRRDIHVARRQAADGLAAGRHLGCHGIRGTRIAARAGFSGSVAQHNVQVVMTGRVRHRQIAHIRGLERDQDRVEAGRAPPVAVRVRLRGQDLINQQLLIAHLDIGEGTQLGQGLCIEVVAERKPRQLFKHGCRQRQAQRIGPLLHVQRAGWQRERDGQVGVGHVGTGGQRIRRPVQHALAAGRVAQRRQRCRRRRQAGQRVVHREREAIDAAHAKVRARGQITQDFSASVAVQAVVVGQAHQAVIFHRRLQRGRILRRRHADGQILAAFGLGAQERAHATQRDGRRLQRTHARPVTVVLRQLRAQVGQNLGGDRRIGLFGGRACVCQFAVQQRTAVERDVDAAHFGKHRRLRVGPIDRFDQHQVRVQHILCQVDALVGAGRAAGQASLGREALPRMDRQRLGSRADGAVARIQFDAVARHNRVATRGRMREDAVKRFDIDRARRGRHFLQRRPGTVAAIREIAQADVVAGFGARETVGTHDVQVDRATQRNRLDIDLRARARRHLAIRIARHDADFALHGDRRRLGRRHGFDMDLLAIADDQIARQRHIAVAADIDGVFVDAGAHEAQRDLLGSGHVEREQFLLLLFDHLRQRGGLGAQPAAATGVRAVIADQHARVELAVCHGEHVGVQRFATCGRQAVARAIRRHDGTVDVLHQRLSAAAFDRGRQQRVVQLAAGVQLVFERVRHGTRAVVGDNRRYQYRSWGLIHRDRAGLGRVLVRQPAQGIPIAKQVEALGRIGGRGGFTGTPAHHPHHRLASLRLVAEIQRLARRQGAGFQRLASRRARRSRVFIDPDPIRLTYAGRRDLHELVPDGMHDVIDALQFIQVALTARRIDDFDAAPAIRADVDIVCDQRVGRLVVDMHRSVAVGDDQVAVAHRHDLPRQRNAATRQADGIQDDGLRRVVKAAGDGAVPVQRTVGTERHTRDRVTVVVLQRLVLVAAERTVDTDVRIGQAALDLAVDIQRQRRDIHGAQREDSRIACGRVVVQVLRERIQLGGVPCKQHVLHRVADAGALAAVLQRKNDVGPAIVEQRGIRSGIEPALALQAEVALGHDIQADGLNRTGHTDAAQRIDHGHLAQRVHYRTQQAQVHRRVLQHAGHFAVQCAAERVGCPSVADLADIDFRQIRTRRALDGHVIDIQVPGLEHLQLAIRTRPDDRAVHDDRVVHIHQHRRIVHDVDLRVGAGVDAGRLHARDVGRADVDRTARCVHIGNVDIERAERIQIADLAIDHRRHLDALQLLFQRGDVRLVTRHGLGVRRMLRLHHRQRADLLADDVLLAAVAQRGLRDVGRLQHVVHAADLVGGKRAEIPAQCVVALFLGQRWIAQPVTVAVVLRRQVQIPAVQAVVVVVIVALLHDHAGRDIDFDVFGAEGGQLIAHVDVDGAGSAIQTGLARAQQLFQNGLDDGRVRVERHGRVRLRGQGQAGQCQLGQQFGRNHKQIGGVVHAGDDLREVARSHLAGRCVHDAIGQVRRGVQIQANHLHRPIDMGLVQFRRIGFQAHVALRLQQRSVARHAINQDGIDLTRLGAAIHVRNLSNAHQRERHIVVGQQITGGQRV